MTRPAGCRVGLWVVICLMVGMASGPATVPSVMADNKLDTYVTKMYNLLASNDSDQQFFAQLELESLGTEVIPFAVAKISSFDSNYSLISAFILSEIQSP